MALCTICLADPCPHLMMRGGTAGAPLVAVGIAAKYAPSSKPHCPSCDRVHRNIGTDNQPVCAWRTYSRARGVDFQPFTPENVEEFASWFKSGAWSAPVKSRKAPATTTPKSGPVLVPTSVGPAFPGVGVSTPVTPPPAPAPTTLTVPVIEEDVPVIIALPDEGTMGDMLRENGMRARDGEPTGPVGVFRPYTKEEEDAAIKRAEDLTPRNTPKKAPAFSKGKMIKDEKKKVPVS